MAAGWMIVLLGYACRPGRPPAVVVMQRQSPTKLAESANLSGNVHSRHPKV